MKNKVLILTVSRKVSLIKAFKDAGWHVTGQDTDPNAVALKFCDEIALPDRECGPFDMILPTRDADLKLGTHRCSDETIDICIDKLKFTEWCKSNNFNTPEFIGLLTTKLRNVCGNTFIKPRYSSSQNKENGEVECIQQRLVEGEEYSVDVFSDLNKQVISIIPRIRLKTISGESCVTKTVKNLSILNSAKMLSESIGLIGHNTLQCFQSLNTLEEPIWTDINARFGGASIVSIQAGCKSPEWYLKLINGEEVKPCIGEYVTGLIGRSYSEWTFDEN